MTQADTVNFNPSIDHTMYYNPDTTTVGYWIDNGDGGDFYTTSGEYSGYYDSGEGRYHLFDAEGIELGFDSVATYDEARVSFHRHLMNFELVGLLQEDLHDVISDGNGGYVVREYVDGRLCAFAYQEDITEGSDLKLVAANNQIGNYQDDAEGLVTMLAELRLSNPQWTKEMKGLYVSSFKGKTLTVEKDNTTNLWQAQAFVFYPDLDDDIVQYSMYADTKEDAMQSLNTYATI